MAVFSPHPLEPLALPRIGSLAVHHRRQRRRLVGPMAAARRGHLRAFIPPEQGIDGAEHGHPPGVGRSCGEHIVVDLVGRS